MTILPLVITVIINSKFQDNFAAVNKLNGYDNNRNKSN
jgi:hypothetical protein